MKNNWKNGKQEVPPVCNQTSKDIFGMTKYKASKKVLILLPYVGTKAGEPRFGYYHHDIKEWMVEGVKGVNFSNTELFWCYIPEYSSEIKNLIKKLKRGQATTS